MEPVKHYFDTAHIGNYTIAKTAAEKAGMKFRSDYRHTCIKKYHFEITAETPDQDTVLTNIILATTAHQEQEIYRKKLAQFIAG